ncbi:MAG TPA: hypothetical protein VKA46_08745 [Gemmataceae bacterium]|nr:hypothetical protein [Gemmataceae bacterium]
MQGPLFQKIRACVSSPRLDIYRQPGDSDFDVIVRYLWNVQLCEALYPSLQALEVAFRNSLHAAATGRFHSEFWFDPPPNRLARSEQADVTTAKADLGKQGKPLEVGRIIAELTFGFWTSLLNTRYERVFWPWMLLPTFPGMPRHIRTRHTVSKRFNEIRALRNRVFHHERIAHWPNLAQRHADLVEAIGWISPEGKRLLPAIDRFAEVYAGAWTRSGSRSGESCTRKATPSNSRGTSAARNRSSVKSRVARTRFAGRPIDDGGPPPRKRGSG